MEPRAGVALWNITDSLDRVYHESRRSSPIRWSVESVDGNVNKTEQKRRPLCPTTLRLRAGGLADHRLL
jgi:hypothetical protein